MSRWVDGCIAKQSARLYHKAHSARGSDYARTVKVEPGTVETREEHARDTNYAPIWVSREGRANCWGTSGDVQDYRDWLELRSPRLFDRRWDEEPCKVTMAIVGMKVGGARGTECRS